MDVRERIGWNLGRLRQERAAQPGGEEGAASVLVVSELSGELGLGRFAAI